MKILSFIFFCLLIFQGKSQFNLHDYFEETAVVHESTVWGNGASFVDFNRDGTDDITTADGNQLVRFFVSNGETFEEVDLGIELAISAQIKAVLWVDYDNDADYDLFVSQSGGRIYMFEQVGDMQFVDVSEQVGFSTNIYNYQGAAFADIDHDGDLDFYVSKYYTPNLNPGAEFASQLYINNGDKTFSDVTTPRGVYLAPRAVFQPVFVDVNADGHLDLYVIIDRAQWVNELFINNGEGFFYPASANSGYTYGIDSMSATVGDYNNDGDPDFFLSDSYGGNVLLDNNGAGFFTNLAESVGVATYGFCWGANWLDANNDGLLDLTIATTTSTNGLAQNILYKQNSDGNFSNVSAEWGLAEDIRPTYCNVVGDFNNDGYPDYYHNNNAPYPSNLWKNDGGNSNWIGITLEGTADNASAIGSQIQVFVNGQTQTRYLLCGESYFGQNSNRKIFGFGQTEMVDSLVVTWPNGTIDRFFNFLAQGNIHITQGETAVESSNYALVSFDSTICPGQTIDITVGQEVVSTIWNTGAESSTLSVNEPGSYHATITTNSGFVFLTDTVVISWQSSPELVSSINHPICFGNADGEILIDTNYEENIIFTIGELQNTEGTFNNLAAGDYTVQAISQNGCASEVSLTLNSPDQIAAIVDPIHELCAQDEYGSVVVSNISGGAGLYTLIFSGENPESLPIGDNQLIILDQNGCFTQFDFTIQEATPILLESVITPSIDDLPGSIQVSASGGTGSINLFINGAPMLLDQIVSAEPGDYIIEIIDENECVVSEIVTIEHLTGIVENSQAWSVFPNPVIDELTIQCERLPNDGKLSVYNTLGENIQVENLINLNHSINTKKWVPGIYFIKIGNRVSSVIKY
ncbi:MAG: FG-GAP-like repeat-containing protein [Flavobacteriales bacterium]